MAYVYNVNVRNSRLAVVRDAIDAGPGGGLIKIGTAGMATVLSTVILSDPCGTIAAGVLTFTAPRVDISADASGFGVAAQITDSTGVVVISGLTVGLSGSGADVIISLQNIAVGSIVTFVSGAITGN